MQNATGWSVQGGVDTGSDHGGDVPLRRSMTFWGKTYGSPPGGPGLQPLTSGWKPLLHHLIDVAAVAEAFLRRNPARLSREAMLLGLAPEDYARLAGFTSGLHDLGKYSRSFQSLVPQLWPIEALGPQPLSVPPARHWRLTALLLRTAPAEPLWAELFPELNFDDLNPIFAAVAGHHGEPPEYDEVGARSTDAARKRDLIGAKCVEAAMVAVYALHTLFSPAAAPAINRAAALHWSWRLSGLTTLADWVASDAAHFGPTERLRGRALDAWHDVIDEPTFADAILDRLVHNAYRLELDGRSMRKTIDGSKAD